ncbi:MAG TPA: RNA methyltransferase, partial [Saprospiraceae bacterium]|nr:RNA methyltransferase [Saprospiraceae bacterium]
LILESVTDVRNLAAIARSALVFGADALVVTAKKSAAIGGDAVKISAGAVLKIPICREKNMISTIDKLRAFGIKLLSTALDQNAKNISQVNLNQPLAIVMGGEGEGVTLETRRASDDLIIIPQVTEFDSLNVSVASGIVLYEVMRQRQ